MIAIFLQEQFCGIDGVFVGGLKVRRDEREESGELGSGGFFAGLELLDDAPEKFHEGFGFLRQRGFQRLGGSGDEEIVDVSRSDVLRVHVEREGEVTAGEEASAIVVGQNGLGAGLIDVEREKIGRFFQFQFMEADLLLRELRLLDLQLEEGSRGGEGEPGAGEGDD